MTKRSYQQSCALARAGDLLGERWTLLIFRELLIQPCRFKDLCIYLSGMGTNLLTQRLKELEGEGLIYKADRRAAYTLTGTGRTVEAVVLPLLRWGLVNTSGSGEGSHFDHWDLLAMKALFHSESCKRRIGIQFDAEQFLGWCVIDPHAGCQIGVGIMQASADILFDGTVLGFRAYMNDNYDSAPRVWREFARAFPSLH